MVLVFFAASSFQFALPRGERQPSADKKWLNQGFQFALPRGERPVRNVSVAYSSGFNSRSRVGSDPLGQPYRYRLVVSIRAPAWGATRGLQMVSDVVRFNSRSRVGSDHRVRRHRGQGRRFNSRSRVGSDLRAAGDNAGGDGFNSRSRVGSDVVGRVRAVARMVSIRAPAWGAT